MSGRIGDLSEEQSRALEAFKSKVTQEFVGDDVSYNNNCYVNLLALIVQGYVFEIPACTKICGRGCVTVRKQ